MMAAAARTSGTTWPSASVLYCGVIASCSCARLRRRDASRARADARARASDVLRARDAVAEYAVFFLEAGARRVSAGLFWAASAVTTDSGRHMPRPSSVDRILTINIGRSTRTKPPWTGQSSRLGATAEVKLGGTATV